MQSSFVLIRKARESIMRSFVCALLIASFAGSLAAIEDTTQTRLTKYIDLVIDTWRKYPTDKQLTVRQGEIQDATAQLTRDITQLDPPEGTTVQKALDHYLSNLSRVSAAMRNEKMKTDRATVVQACSATFKREIRTASDVETETPGSKILERIMSWHENAKAQLRASGDEVTSSFNTALNDATTVLMQHAVKDTGDPAAIYDKNLKEIHNRFPTKSPALQKSNQQIAGSLESLAKLINTLDKKE